MHIAYDFDPSCLTDTLMEMIRHRSDFPNATEEACCRYITDILTQEGLHPRMVEAANGRPNIYATLNGTEDGPTFLFNGHLDVVPADEASWTYSPFEPVIENGRVFGRGAADMKAGVASCIHAALFLKRSGAPFKGRIVLFFNVDEEATNLGMKQFLSEQIEADFAIIAEPTENAIHLGHRGNARYVIRTRGTPEHIAWATEPDNAIEKMADLVAALRVYRQSLLEKRHDFLGTASAGVTLINGGEAGNIVPGRCQITVDRRLLLDETPKDIEREIKAHLQKHEIECEVENISGVDASLIPGDHPMVQRLREAIAATGETPRTGRFPATCEAPYFTRKKGIPAVIFGPGSIAQAHVNDEFVQLDEVAAHCQALIRFVAGE